MKHDISSFTVLASLTAIASLVLCVAFAVMKKRVPAIVFGAIFVVVFLLSSLDAASDSGAALGGLLLLFALAYSLLVVVTIAAAVNTIARDVKHRNPVPWTVSAVFFGPITLAMLLLARERAAG